jgi:RimJ/RimL family protein N-acetyltransferase
MKKIHLPSIRKADFVHGKSLVFHDATEAYADFILSLRTDSIKSRYLSVTSADLQSQKDWLKSYAFAAGQAYFIIYSNNKPVGTVRLYDAQGESFCWGSWILSSEAPGTAAVESALMVYAYAIDHLDFKAAHFDVRKGNESVWKFHERFGAQRTHETREDFIYQITLDAILQARSRYAKFLPAGVRVGGKSL